jgi:hypothetical protein
MAFSRPNSPCASLKGDALTAAMAGIGMAFAATPMPNPNIEDTLLAASVEGLEHDDLRVLALLTTWVEVHHPWINADRLIRLISQYPGSRVKTYWCAMGMYLAKDRRFARLTRVHAGPPMDLLSTGTAFHLGRSGEDPRFVGGPLRVPAGILRNRIGDVLSPAELARIHGAYRARIQLGPSYRADLWADLERNPNLSATALARRNYGSFATAWHVQRDWKLLHGPDSPAQQAASPR